MIKNVRYANESDSLLLTDLGHKTFYDAYSDKIAPEDLAILISKRFSAEKQILEMKDPNVTFLIAEINNIPVGYTKLKAHDKGDGISGTNPMKLERIYLVKESIGQGVGKELMKESIRDTQERGFNCLWLEVWEENKRAIKFYERWEFKKVGEHFVELSNVTHRGFNMELHLPV